MSDNGIYKVGTPANEKDAANKKYVDDNAGGTFKDGTTKPAELDIRKVTSANPNGADYFVFHSDVRSGNNVTSRSSSDAIINKNSLQTSGLVGLNSLVPTLKTLLSALQEQKFDANISLLVLTGTPTTHTIKHQSSLVNTVTFNKVGNDTQLDIHFRKDLAHGIYSYEFEISSDYTGGFDIYMYGACGGAGFRATTLYRYWAADFKPSGTPFNYSAYKGKLFNAVEQKNKQGGYFQRGAGKKVQFKGSFRYSGDKIINTGKPFSLNTDASDNKGKTYEFLVQELTLVKPPTSTHILGSSLTFVIEPDTNVNLDLKADSYFSVSRNVALTV